VAQPSRVKKNTRSKVLSSVADEVEKRLEENQIEDLTKTAVVWSAMLDLETTMLPSQVAALLSVYSTVRATTLVEAEEHWKEAAVLSVAAAHADIIAISASKDQDILQDTEAIAPSQGIGFAAGIGNQQQS
jgi:hypothetical protein